AGVNVLAAYGSLCGRDRQTTENSSPPATTNLTSSGVIPELRRRRGSFLSDHRAAGFARSLSRRTLLVGSADVGRQVLIRRDQRFPACLDVVGFTAGEVCGEVFGVDLPAGSEEGDLVQGHASN